MFAIFKREFKSYFSSPIGYVVLAVLLFLFGFFFYQILLYRISDLIASSVYGSMFTMCMMVIPIITMKSLSEDKKNKTDQALITAPVGVTSIVFGKFLAAFCVYAIAMVLTLIPSFIISLFSELSWGPVIGNVVGTLLYGAAMISIGVFISSLTESQVIAAISTFGVSILMIVIGSAGSIVNNSVVTQIVNWISFNTRYQSFTTGIFNISSVVYFLSVVAIFVFLTARKIESRRWS
ncbi:MAG TPA: ABC transporter permease [Candidatus Gallacutalibacter pullicola]|uniref:ABC transporter permease n=1 Tax=Candidatus Gallacutalibacter pullicola TaxID=2840830 RepID=A0A9D1DQI5_9FIRM|nr:ABC transporter permease [Candidatus Gallacutalibacter pullicola]